MSHQQFNDTVAAQEEYEARKDAEWDAEMRYMQAQYFAERKHEESQDALPPHKQDGYAERMAEMADIRRDELKENGQ